MMHPDISPASYAPSHPASRQPASQAVSLPKSEAVSHLNSVREDELHTVENNDPFHNMSAAYATMDKHNSIENVTAIGEPSVVLSKPQPEVAVSFNVRKMLKSIIAYSCIVLVLAGVAVGVWSQTKQREKEK